MICGRSGELIIWFFEKANNFVPLESDILLIFRPRTGLANFVKALAQTAVNFRRNSVASGNLNILSPFIPVTSEAPLITCQPG